MRAIMAGSAIRESHREGDTRVQDPYCIRCQPQVTGAAMDLLRQVAGTLEVEANAATDNPLVLADVSSRAATSTPSRSPSPLTSSPWRWPRSAPSPSAGWR